MLLTDRTWAKDYKTDPCYIFKCKLYQLFKTRSCKQNETRNFARVHVNVRIKGISMYRTDSKISAFLSFIGNKGNVFS